jgi:hypothetical protein
LSAEFYPAVVKAIQQGRWRNAKNPRTYIKTVARREAFKEDLAAAANDPLVLLRNPSGADGFSVESSLDHISYVRDTPEAVQGGDGVWRRGGGAERDQYERYDEDENGNAISLRGRLLAKVPNSLKVLIKPSAEYKRAINRLNSSTDEWHIHPEPSVSVDMKKWAELAGFDEWEMRVLEYRLGEVSRDEAMAEQPDETSRKALQAAWRRYDRTGKQRLRETAEKKAQEDVPERASLHTS